MMEPKNIPVLALRGLTVFPHMTINFDVERHNITDWEVRDAGTAAQ